MPYTFHPHLSRLYRQPLRLRLSLWLLALVVCWQALIMLMPVAQAKVAAGDGHWETICTLQGSAQVWAATGSDADSDHEKPAGGHCPLCLMSQTGIAPPAVFNVNTHQTADAQLGQLTLSAVYLTRAWSEPATGPPART